MMGYCREKKKRLLVSEQVIDQIEVPVEFALEDLGVYQPRGKGESLRVYSVTKK
jgi:class 3 adenylate cyclase